MPNSRKGFGFTLAEVLITLGIIGVVAALTMPSLITNYQKKQTVVQLRKVYSDLNNAVRRSEVDNGPKKQWEYPSAVCYTYSCVEPFVKKYYLPYFPGARFVKKAGLKYYYSEAGLANGLGDNYLILNNGVILSFFVNVPTNYIWLFADVNGIKGPNRAGRDIFVFEAYREPGIVLFGKDTNRLTDTNNAGTFQNGDNYSYACSKDNNMTYKNFFCGRFIEVNNWEIPDDYPW